MVSGRHFHLEVGHDDRGVTVTVTHKPTGRREVGRPNPTEQVRAVQMRLVHDLLAGLVDRDAFVYRVGRCQVDGRFGNWYEIEHIPTGRKKSLDTITWPDVKHPHEELLDLLTEELWQEGLLPKP